MYIEIGNDEGVILLNACVNLHANTRCVNEHDLYNCFVSCGIPY